MIALSNASKFVKGSIHIESFLVDFNYMHYKANPYVEELLSSYIRSDMYVNGYGSATMFTYFDIVLNDEEIDYDGFEEDLRDGLIEEVCEEDGLKWYKKDQMVHWWISVSDSNVKESTFYIHADDFVALHSYLYMLREDNPDMEDVEFVIVDRRLKVNDEFEILLYD